MNTSQTSHIETIVGFDTLIKKITYLDVRIQHAFINLFKMYCCLFDRNLVYLINIVE